VAQVYRRWYDVSDEEVIRILKRWRREHRSGQASAPPTSAEDGPPRS
jgi:hypothetical protein